MKIKVKYTLALIGTLGIISGCSAEAAPAEEVSRDIPIALSEMKKDVIEHTYISVGEIVPNKQVDLYVNGGGFIEEIAVAGGQWVEEGMMVIRLDDSEIDMTNYKATESQLRTLRDNIGAQLEATRDNYSRQQELFNEGIITRIEMDQLALQVENLEREYDNSANAYRNQLSILKDGLEDAKAARFIESPVSGTVAGIYIQEGQSVIGQLGLSIIDDSRLFVKTYVSGDVKKALDLGDTLRISLDGKDERTQEGIIHEIQTLPDQATRLFQVLIEIDKQDGWIIGDYTEVTFIIDRYEAIMVPMEAVIRKGSQQFVYVYEEGKLNKVVIEPGRTKASWLEVKNMDGISQVVVRGQNQLTLAGEFTIVDQ